MQPCAQHYTRRVLGTTRAESAHAVTGGAETLAPNPIMISVDRIVVMVPDLERLGEGCFRVQDSLRVQDFEILECHVMDAWCGPHLWIRDLW